MVQKAIRIPDMYFNETLTELFSVFVSDSTELQKFRQKWPFSQITERNLFSVFLQKFRIATQ